MDYEYILEQIYTKIIEPGDNVIDIGAHSGRHTLPMVSLVADNGKIYAFEPNPEARRNLTNNVSEAIVNGIVSVFPYALSNTIETTQFIIANDRPEESGLLQRQYNGPTTIRHIEVEVVTLDSIFKKIENTIKFIKIDVEGAEYNALQGAYKIIKHNMPFIAFEFGECSYKPYAVQPNEMFDYLKHLHYKIYSITGKQLNQQEFVAASRIQDYWDYIACPENKTKQLEGIFQQIQPKKSKMKQLFKRIFLLT